MDSNHSSLVTPLVVSGFSLGTFFPFFLCLSPAVSFHGTRKGPKQRRVILFVILQEWLVRHMNNMENDSGNSHPPRAIPDADVSIYMHGGDDQSRICKATHALSSVDVGIHQVNLPQKLRINNPRNLLVIPQLMVEASRAINLGGIMQTIQTPRHGVGCHQIRKLFQRNGTIILDGFLSGSPLNQ